MKTVLAILTAGLCLATTFAQISWEIPAPVEGHPNECFVDDKFYKVNETWQLKDCGLGTCAEQDTDGSVQLVVTKAYCGLVAPGEAGCTLVSNKELPHPKCCPEVECPKIEKDDSEASATDTPTEPSATDIPSKREGTDKPSNKVTDKPPTTEKPYVPIGSLLTGNK